MISVFVFGAMWMFGSGAVYAWKNNKLLAYLWPLLVWSHLGYALVNRYMTSVALEAQAKKAIAPSEEQAAYAVDHAAHVKWVKSLKAGQPIRYQDIGSSWWKTAIIRLNFNDGSLALSSLKGKEIFGVVDAQRLRPAEEDLRRK